MSETLLHRDDEGEVKAKGNEVIIEDRTAGDPVAIRFRSNNETRGKHSIDKFVDGAWREIGLIIYKEDERGRTNPSHRNALEVNFLTHIAVRDTFEDADYETMFGIRHDGVVFYKGGVVADIDRIISADGRFVTVQQSDGNLVTYKAVDGVITGPAVWSSGYVEG